eukprot:TRINITY_DN18736_c0_g1_i1.p1 TRINITY_DN18736_c0_g1~~TRINITY_DN18736_c0_g1_i1.p1  ORF type:complete len:388 (+),score=48.81 TRINITY_DN18736_c0_g1_i1:60-1223(+)
MSDGGASPNAQRVEASEGLIARQPPAALKGLRSGSMSSMDDTPIFPPKSPRDWRGQRRQDKRGGKSRVVRATGASNIEHVESMRDRLFFLDFFLTVVHWRWVYALAFIFFVYFVSWLVFALFWYMVPEDCATGAETVTGALLLSIELQATIGFGNTYVEKDCFGGAVLLGIQVFVGCVLDAVLLGLVLTKASRAKSRSKTILCSSVAVVCERNGELCLLFRVVDIRKRNICEAHARAYCYLPGATREGEELDWEAQELDIGYDTGADRLFLLLPAVLCHKITPRSPLYGMNADALADSGIEIVVVIEGSVEATGLVAQTMASYNANDILWGHRFAPMVSRGESGRPTVDHSLLDCTVQAPPGPHHSLPSPQAGSAERLGFRGRLAET